MYQVVALRVSSDDVAVLLCASLLVYKSWSVSRMQHISGYTAPPTARYTPMPPPASRKYELPATDDFGSFKAQQHTTFQDTKV